MLNHGGRVIFFLLVVSVIAAAQQEGARKASAAPISAADRARIERIEKQTVSFPTGDTTPPLQLSLAQLMKVLKIPAVSVAVVDNFQIVWAKAYGVTAMGGTKPATTHTLFQAGSISKPVAAAGALWLVEHGKLELDEDINNKLTSWKVPQNQFTEEQKVTLRRLMSHSAGLTVHGFPGYTVDEPVPTLPQILNGEKPANTAPVRVDFVPGSKLRYSGGGVTIEQQAVVDVTGEPFPAFMRKTVLDRVGMTDSTFEQPLPSNRAATAASGTRSDGKTLEGKWHVYPEMAAAGLWTTPTDLAKFAIEIAVEKNGKSNRVLSPVMAKQMLTPQIAGDEPGHSVGLGFFLGYGNPQAFGHDGADEGFQAGLKMFSDTGQGIAMMGNSDSFFSMARYVEEVVAREYGWNDSLGKRRAGNVVALFFRLKGLQAALQEYEYLKKERASEYVTDSQTLNQFGYVLLNDRKTEDAIQVFKMNVAAYPEDANTYDSLGEAYMRAGQKDLAIKNYEKSLELDPNNENGRNMLKKLKAQ